MARLLVSSLLLFFALSAPAATNVVTSGETAMLLPAVATLDTHAGITTNQVETVGAFYRDGGRLLQYTDNGWVNCPSSRRMVIVRRIDSGDGTAMVRDGSGDLIPLSAGDVVTLTAEHAPQTPVYVRADGGDVTVFTSQR